MTRRSWRAMPSGSAYSTGSPARAAPSVETSREVTASPHAVTDCLPVAVGLESRRENDERRQIVVLAAKTVGQPRPDAGLPRHFRSGHHERTGRIVVDGVGGHGLSNVILVDNPRRVRQQIDIRRNARLARLSKAETRTERWESDFARWSWSTVAAHCGHSRADPVEELPAIPARSPTYRAVTERHSCAEIRASARGAKWGRPGNGGWT